MTDYRKVLVDLSLSSQAKHRKCEGLKGRTPEQIKNLAQHYYNRARHAEARFETCQGALKAAVAEIDRLESLASEMIGDA